MKSTGFERWTQRFETADITSTKQMLDYISPVFITYIMSHFHGDFSYKIGRKTVENGFKYVIRRPNCAKIYKVFATVIYCISTKWKHNRK